MDTLDAAVHSIHPELLAAMKAVISFHLPNARTREQLWRALVPPSCPLHEGVEFDTLARESVGFGASRIQSCIFRAAGFATLPRELPREKASAKKHGDGKASPQASEQGKEQGAGGAEQGDKGGAAGTAAGAAAAEAATPGKATSPLLRMADLLRVVREERDKERGTRDALQRSMVS